MGKLENDLRDLIIRRYGTLNNFCKKEGIPNSTISTIFSKGVGKGNITTMIKLCRALHISTDALADGYIQPIISESILKTDDLEEIIEVVKSLVSDSLLRLDDRYLGIYEQRYINASLDNIPDVIRSTRDLPTREDN